MKRALAIMSGQKCDFCPMCEGIGGNNESRGEVSRRSIRCFENCCHLLRHIYNLRQVE